MSDMKELSDNQQVQNDYAKTNVRYENSGKAAFAQILALLIQNWLLLIIAMELTIPTVIIGALLRNPAETLNMDEDQASWFGSMTSICHPIGCMMSGLFQEKFGRRGSTVLINIPIFVSWLLLYFAHSIPILYVVSASWGLTIGLAEAPMHAYIGEIGEPHMRGTLSTITTLAGTVGGLMIYVIGYFFDWRTVALICSAFPVFGLFLMTQIPESPTWLIVRNRLDDAKKSLCWLRGWVQSKDVEEEFQALVDYVKNSTEQNGMVPDKSIPWNGDVMQEVCGKKHGYLKTQLRKLTDKRLLRPLRLVFTVFVFASTACVIGIMPYLINVHNDLGSPIDSTLVMMIYKGVYFVGGMANVVFIRRFGKRKLALFSNVLAAACIFGIGAYSSYFKSLAQYPQLAWIPIILFCIHHFLQGLSLFGLPWQLVCEVYPLTARGTATGISASWSHLVHFTMIKSFLVIEALLSLSGALYLYGTGTVLGIVYYYFYLPETEGKTLAQIESYFTDNHDRKEKFSVGKPGKYIQSSS